MSTSVIESLRSTLSGALVGESDAGYDEARVVYNAKIDRRPAAIVRSYAPLRSREPISRSEAEATACRDSVRPMGL
jgi:hypothetical protein